MLAQTCPMYMRSYSASQMLKRKRKLSPDLRMSISEGTQLWAPQLRVVRLIFIVVPSITSLPSTTLPEEVDVFVRTVTCNPESIQHANLYITVLYSGVERHVSLRDSAERVSGATNRLADDATRSVIALRSYIYIHGVTSKDKVCSTSTSDEGGMRGRNANNGP